MNFPDDIIRQRSYQIWLREGCPQGLAAQHWFQAQAELESELRGQRGPLIDRDSHQFVLPRPPISRPPRKVVALRLRELDCSRAA